MFNRIRLVATREFLTTVTSKGFLIGVFVMPLIGLALTFAIPKIMAQRGAQITVEVALIESSGTLADTLRRELDPEVIIARRNAGRRAAMEQAAPGTGDMAEKAPTPQLTVPKFIVKVLPAANEANEASTEATTAARMDGSFSRVGGVPGEAGMVSPCAERSSWGGRSESGR